MFIFVIYFKFFTRINFANIRVIYLYTFKLGNNAAKRNINQTFGEDIVTKKKIQHWFEKFHSADLSL